VRKPFSRRLEPIADRNSRVPSRRVRQEPQAPASAHSLRHEKRKSCIVEIRYKNRFIVLFGNRPERVCVAGTRWATKAYLNRKRPGERNRVWQSAPRAVRTPSRLVFVSSQCLRPFGGQGLISVRVLWIKAQGYS